jgi:Lrp/AsnC family transcriptional regulator, leucine-responsive regulatory protein
MSKHDAPLGRLGRRTRPARKAPVDRTERGDRADRVEPLERKILARDPRTPVHAVGRAEPLDRKILARDPRTPVHAVGRADQLDPLDRKILARYQHDTRTPAHAIGRAVGLSTAAVQRRLKRLRAVGVIEAEVAQLAPAALGAAVTCIVGVELERERAVDLARFRDRMCSYAEVQQCYYTTGQSDFILVILAQDVAAYDAFTRRVLTDDRNVRGFTTHVVLERVKVGLAVPLDEAAPPSRRARRS